MATREEVLGFMQARYRFDQVNDYLYRATFDYESGREQVVLIEFRQDFVLFSSRFGSIQDLSAEQALEATNEWIFGMRKIDNSYWLRHVAPIKNIDENEIDDGLKLLAFAADEIKAKFPSTDGH